MKDSNMCLSCAGRSADLPMSALPDWTWSVPLGFGHLENPLSLRTAPPSPPAADGVVSTENCIHHDRLYCTLCPSRRYAEAGTSSRI